MRFIATFGFAVGTLAALVAAGPLPQANSLEVLVNRDLAQQLTANGQESELAKRIVWNPKILTPAGGEIWTAGSVHTATWDLSGAPAEVNSKPGQLKLGYTAADGSEVQKYVLAQNFKLGDGKVTFTLPASLEQRSTYFLVLFGDSGNKSNKITINPASTTHAAELYSKREEDTGPWEVSH